MQVIFNLNVVHRKDVLPTRCVAYLKTHAHLSRFAQRADLWVRQNAVNGIEHNSRKGKTLLSLFTATTVILEALRLSLLSLFYYFIFLKTFTCIGSVKYMYFPPTLCTRNLTNRPYISGLVIVLWTHKEKQFLWKRLYWKDEYLGKDHEVSLGGDGKITSTRGLDTPWMGLGD